MKALPSFGRKRGADVGEPPLIVSTGAPGARDEVLKYADRIEAAWQDFLKNDFSPWLQKKGLPTVDKSDWGTVAVTTATTATATEIATAKATIQDYINFNTFHESINKDLNPFGPSPSAAWQTLQEHENVLNADRVKFQTVSGVPLVSKITPLETPGGVKQTGVADILDSVKWVAAAVLGIVVVQTIRR